MNYESYSQQESLGGVGGIPAFADPGFQPRPEPEPFRRRLRAALEEGILWGVKLGLAMVLVIVALSYVFGDYTTTRQRALNGQQAFEFIQRQLAAQAKTPPPGPAPGP